MSDEQKRLSIDVCIIESPSPADLLQERTEGRMLLETLRLSGMSAKYRLAVSSDAFITALGQLFDGADPKHRRLALHLSTHGNSEGIVLSDWQLITWDTLRKPLIAINAYFDGYLLLALSCCEGMAGLSMDDGSGPSPFYAILSHNGAVSWADSALGFSIFYHRMNTGTNWGDALEAMQAATGSMGFDMRLSTDAKNRIAKQRVEKAKASVKDLQTRLLAEIENMRAKPKPDPPSRS
jgi:hypothetical protein